jgi:O-antigen/teichoic acid export membrane protein
MDFRATADPGLRRLARGTAANLVGRLGFAAVQIVTIPVLTRAWGVEGFGAWVMLATIPTYLALADAGMGVTASVEMTRRNALGDTDGALSVFQTFWLFATGIATLLALAAAGAAALLLMAGAIDIAGLDGPGLFGTILALGGYAVLVTQSSVVVAVFHATGKYASGTLISEAAAPLEGIAIMAVALAGGGLPPAALVLLAVRAVVLVVLFGLVLRHEPWARPGVEHARLSLLGRLLPASLGGLSLTAAHAVILQGVVLVLGAVSGPVAAAVYASSRTLARIPVQLAALVVRASIPELSRSLAAGNRGSTRRFRRINVAATLALCLPGAAVLGFAGPALLTLVSGQSLAAENSLFVALGIGALLHGGAAAAAGELVAAHRLGYFAPLYLVVGLAAVATLAMLPAATPTTAAALVLVAEAAGLAAALAAFRKMSRPDRAASAR